MHSNCYELKICQKNMIGSFIIIVCISNNLSALIIIMYIQAARAQFFVTIDDPFLMQEVPSYLLKMMSHVGYVFNTLKNVLSDFL